MSNWKRKAIGFLGASSLMLGLAACGNDADDASVDEGTDSATETETDTEEITEILWYHLGQEPKDFDMVMEKVNEKTMADIGVKVDMRLIPDGDFQEKMGVIINSGEKYDITFVNGSDYANFSKRGAFVGLNDHLDKELAGYVDIMDPGFITGAAIDGELYGVPVNNNLATTEYWTFDEELLKEYDINVDDVSSIESLEPVLDEFAEKNTDPSVTPLGQTKTSAYVPYDEIMGGNLPLAVPFTGDTDTIVNMYQTDEMMAYLTKMHDFYKKGHIIQDAATITNNPFTLDQDTWFVQRQSGGEKEHHTLALEGIKDSGVVLRPLGDAYKTTGFARVALQAVSASSDNPEKALELLNYVNTDKEVADLLVYGLEDVHYERRDDGSIKMTNMEDYHQGAWALLNTRLVSKTTPITEESEAIEEASLEFQENAPESPIFGFTFDASDFRTQIATIQNIMDKYTDSLASGSVDPQEVLPKMNEELEAAGIEDIRESAQEQYDEWRENR